MAPDRAGRGRQRADCLAGLPHGKEDQNCDVRLQRRAEDRTGEEVEPEQIDEYRGQDEREIRRARVGEKPCVEWGRPIMQAVAHTVLHRRFRAHETLRPEPEDNRDGDESDAHSEVAGRAHDRGERAEEAASICPSARGSRS